MIVRYKCECMAQEAEVLVPDIRPGANRDLWMDAVRAAIAQDHRALSPNCAVGDFQYVHLPESADQP